MHPSNRYTAPGEVRLSITSSNKARQSFDLSSGGEYSTPTPPDQARHLRFQYQWKIKSCVSSLSLELACVQQSLSRHNYWVTCPPPAVLKRVFCQEACAHLLIRSEAEPKSREQATTVPTVHTAYFLAQLQSTQRVGCRMDEWFW